MDLDVSHLKDHDVHLIKVKGRLDSYYASQLENSLKPVLKGARKIILDCSEVTFLSSAGIQVLLLWTDLLRARGGDLVLLNLQEAAKGVLRTSKTLDLFCHTDDPNEATRLLEEKKESPSK